MSDPDLERGLTVFNEVLDFLSLGAVEAVRTAADASERRPSPEDANRVLLILPRLAMVVSRLARDEETEESLGQLRAMLRYPLSPRPDEQP